VLPAFHFTTEPLVNPVPVMVTERSLLPAVALDGERLAMAGGLAIAN
jgi:hypothetical protein